MCMSKKAKGVIKFFIACGVVISAVAAVFAVLYRMCTKLRSTEAADDEMSEDGCCTGECDSCDMCGGNESEELDEDVAEVSEIEE